MAEATANQVVAISGTQQLTGVLSRDAAMESEQKDRERWFIDTPQWEY